MTLNDLKEDLSALGFERDIEIDKSLITAIRRALATVYTERGVYQKLTLEHFPKRPTLIFKSFTHKMNDNESFNLTGAAYSFTVCGRGSYTIEANGINTVYNFDTPHSLCRGFIPSEATLTFSGKYAFCIINLATFAEISSDREEDLFAYGEPFIYNVSDYAPSFHSFASCATDELGREIRGIHLYGEVVEVPWNYEGRINLTYKSAPPEVTLNSTNEDIAVPKESEHLIALLAAAYYWLDDSPDKAEYYLLLYRDALDSVKRYDTRRIGGGYQNVTGWI